MVFPGQVSLPFISLLFVLIGILLVFASGIPFDYLCNFIVKCVTLTLYVFFFIFFECGLCNFIRCLDMCDRKFLVLSFNPKNSPLKLIKNKRS